MRRAFLALAVAGVVAVAAGGASIASGSCPNSSHNPGGTPPNCGHTPPSPPPPPPPPPPKACGFANPPDGPISGIVGQVGVAVGDNQLGNLVVDIGCALQKDLGL
jgi:hypothetical protein